MARLKSDQIGNKGLSRVIGNYERPVHNEIGLDSIETLCGPLPPAHNENVDRRCSQQMLEVLTVCSFVYSCCRGIVPVDSSA